MGTKINLLGHQFGNLTVIKESNIRNASREAQWDCECICGNIITVSGRKLRLGKVTDCGCQPKKIKTRKHMDLTGQRFGRLTVIEELPERDENKRIQWKCKCDCGNIFISNSIDLRQGNTVSCGCKRKEHFSIKDLTGQQFGYLTVLKQSEKQHKYGNILWDCECICGNIVSVQGNQLTGGKTKSCGCMKGQIISDKKLQDLTGQQFGKLTVIRRAPNHPSNNFVYWYCDCECGTKDYIVSGQNLKQGYTQSCGCLTLSQGATKISTILQENNILFEREKTFDNCRFPKSNYKARFDFYLPDYNILIEYDGIQHFEPVTKFGGEEKLLTTQERDSFKNQWCKENNIILIRIPYTRLKDICLQDLLLESTFKVNNE